jgi:hypothetical protein
MSGTLLAGTGRADITPAPGTPQGGWGAQTHQRGLGADLPFYATALILSDGAQQVAIVDVDSIGFDAEWTGKIIDEIESLSGLPRTHIRFSCTHTHSGPNTFRLATISEGLDMAVAYLESLPRRIAGAVWQARQKLEPVRVAAGAGSCDIGVNRRFHPPGGGMAVGRDWQKEANPEVRVIRIDSLDERPVATLVHYSCHPTTMAWQCQFFTPDYPGMVKQVVEREMGGLCLFLQGAPGDITPRRGFTGDTAVYRRLGTILGLEAARVATGLETLPRRERFVSVLPSGADIAIYEDEPVEPAPPVLRVIARMMDMPLKCFDRPEVLEAEAEGYRAELLRLRAAGDLDAVRAMTAKATQAGWRAGNARLYHGKTTTPWMLQGIRIGDIALVCVQGEPFNQILRSVVAASPFPHTLFSGYSNGGFGYIPMPDEYPHGGYEVAATPFAPEAAAEVVRQAGDLLKELRA